MADEITIYTYCENCRRAGQVVPDPAASLDDDGEIIGHDVQEYATGSEEDIAAHAWADRREAPDGARGHFRRTRALHVLEYLGYGEEDETGGQTAVLVRRAENAIGLRYDSPKADAILNPARGYDWSDHWPIIDRDGLLTGGIYNGGDDRYWNVDDLAMIDADEARAGGWTLEGGYASPPAMTDTD